jgi:MFS family permease
MVMFNLYLLSAGFDIKFVGLLVGIDMLFHGLFAFPAGLIGDRLGRRRTFFLATTMNITARVVTLLTLNPTALIILTCFRGMGEGFHMVVGAPFMMENSQPEERPHLFTINFSFQNLSRFVGFLAGGFLPLFWAGILGVPNIDPEAGRWALITSLPLTFVSLIPLIMMREKPMELVESIKDLVTLKNIVNFSILAKLGICSLLLGLSFGFMIRFFNIFFQEGKGATIEQTATIMAIGSLGGATVILGVDAEVGQGENAAYHPALLRPFHYFHGAHQQPLPGGVLLPDEGGLLQHLHAHPQPGSYGASDGQGTGDHSRVQPHVV